MSLRSRSRTITSSNSSRIRGSSPTVGSSRKRTVGSETSARAISSRRRSPPLYVPTGRSTSSASAKASTIASSRPSISRPGTPHRRAWISRFRRPVRGRSTTGSWNRTLLMRRAASGSVATSKPASRALPPVGATVPVSMPIVVDFPAPLGPRRLNTSPGRTSKSTPETASTPPGKSLRSPRTWIADPFVMMVPPRSRRTPSRTERTAHL